MVHNNMKIDQLFLDGVPSKATYSSLTGISGLVTLFVNIIFAIAGIVLLVYFVGGGLAMISSAGKNDPQKAEQAKKTLTSAVIGFVIVFVSYWVVSLIGQIMGIQILQGLFAR